MTQFNSSAQILDGSPTLNRLIVSCAHEASIKSRLSIAEIETLTRKAVGELRNDSEGAYHVKPAILESIHGKLGIDAIPAFHKGILLYLITTFDIEDLRLQLPHDMLSLYRIEFERIVMGIEDTDDSKFLWENDRFLKDLAICSGRAFPIGPGIVEISGLPRILLLKRGLRQFFSVLKMLVFQLHGNRPVLSVHTHLARVDLFNPGGWDDAFRLAAQVLNLNVQLKGLMRSSWFIDPVISEISPNLSYLRKIPLENGAAVFFMSEEGGESGAFARSKSRVLLYKQGRYRPAVYYLVWPRKAMLKWLRGGRDTY